MHVLRQLLKSPGFTAVAALMLALGIGVGKTAIAAEESLRNPWPVVAPEEVGLDSAALAEMLDYAREQNIPVHSIQILRHGKLALDAYFYPYRDGMRHDVASVTKSVTATLVGIAIDKGYLKDVRQPVLSFFPSREIAHLDARKRGITLEHLLTMQAGWDCGFEPKEARLFEMRRSPDWLQFMLDLPMATEPGTRFAYCSGNSHMLSMLLTQAVQTNALDFARRELFEPLGIRDVWWPGDPRGNTHGWGDLQLHPRDMAKIGQLFLQRGRWNDRQLLSETWIQAATRAHVERTVNRDHYGYAWWVKGEDHPGMFEAVGRGGQRINVWPAKDLVLVFTGSEFEPGDLTPFILKALRSDEPLPANREASLQLQQRVTLAAAPPAVKPVAALPDMARRISGRTFALSTNTLGASSLKLVFDQSAQGEAELLWSQHGLQIPFGLDGVERFSSNPLVDLPQAAKGQWMGGDTFLLELDLVGAINFYRLKCAFSGDGNVVEVTLNERTGLNHERISGTTQP
ncbi:MAG: serine hydrolase [Verrucomicrobiae bacterium]|nr:serine hydrolase [Verrucomicrobiae bacterium]